MNNSIEDAARLLLKSSHTTAFTGAGISVESGIPPFRGPNGIWTKYDPKVLELDYFNEHPDESWQAIKGMFYDYFGKAVPNAAHQSIAKLEDLDIVKAIITQNIDNLHQEAGSKVVWEYHGNYKHLICPQCGKMHEVSESDLQNIPPLCENDQSVLKPDFVFFGESIPQKASAASFHEASVADVFLLVGTTGEVMPANMIPRLAKQNGATIIEVNTDWSAYTRDISDFFLKGRAGEVLPQILDVIYKEKKNE